MLHSISANDGRRRDATSWFYAIYLTCAIAAAFLLLVPDTRHWFILPTLMCGVLVGPDAVDWARKKLDVLDPRAIIALFGLHFFFLAPLLHVTWDYWPAYVSPAADWRFSLGVLSTLNAIGLALYRIVVSRRLPELVPRNDHIDERRLRLTARIGASIGVGALGVVVWKFGGPGGYLAVAANDRAKLTGNGWLLVVGEAWPFLLFAATLVVRRDHFRSHRAQLLILFLLFLLFQFLCGGLRGSRSNTLWPVLIAVGMIHLVVLPIKRRTLIFGAAILILFMQLYGYYKFSGTKGIDALRDGLPESSTNIGISYPQVLLEDFGRAGTQAIVIDRYQRGRVRSLGYGISYVGDVAAMLPQALLEQRLRNKVALGTDALYGAGSYVSGVRSSRIYGLVGEAILNFGLVGGPIAFLALGCYIRFAVRIFRSAQAYSAMTARVLSPAVSIVAIIMLGSDLDNVVWFTVKQILPLWVVLFLARRASSGATVEPQSSDRIHVTALRGRHASGARDQDQSRWAMDGAAD